MRNKIFFKNNLKKSLIFYQMENKHFFKCNVSSEWCKNQIDIINNKDPKLIHRFTSNGKFLNDKYIDNNFAQELFRLVPENIKKKYKIKRANNVIMTGKYSVGQSFGLHLDTPIYYTETEKSRFTFLIYLNGDFYGGETEFFTNDFKSEQMFKPIEGYGMLFDKDYWHCGRPVTSGTKYWLHIELIC